MEINATSASQGEDREEERKCGLLDSITRVEVCVLIACDQTVRVVQRRHIRLEISILCHDIPHTDCFTLPSIQTNTRRLISLILARAFHR